MFEQEVKFGLMAYSKLQLTIHYRLHNKMEEVIEKHEKNTLTLLIDSLLLSALLFLCTVCTQTVC